MQPGCKYLLLRRGCSSIRNLVVEFKLKIPELEAEELFQPTRPRAVLPNSITSQVTSATHLATGNSHVQPACKVCCCDKVVLSRVTCCRVIKRAMLAFKQAINIQSIIRTPLVQALFGETSIFIIKKKQIFTFLILKINCL